VQQAVAAACYTSVTGGGQTGEKDQDAVPVIPVDTCAGAGADRGDGTDMGDGASVTIGSDVKGGVVKIVTVESAPLLLLLNHTLQNSDNLYAEAMLRALGNGSSDAGLLVNAAVLNELGAGL
jgi:hypothetical protein